MARTLPNSKLNPKKVRTDDAYNNRIDRADVLATEQRVAQVAKQPNKRLSERVRKDRAEG